MTRFFVRTVGSRFHVVDDATGFVVAGFWSLADATADARSRTALAAATERMANMGGTWMAPALLARSL